jgi:hypothetical protein
MTNHKQENRTTRQQRPQRSLFVAFSHRTWGKEKAMRLNEQSQTRGITQQGRKGREGRRAKIPLCGLAVKFCLRLWALGSDCRCFGCGSSRCVIRDFGVKKKRPEVRALSANRARSTFTGRNTCRIRTDACASEAHRTLCFSFRSSCR